MLSGDRPESSRAEPSRLGRLGTVALALGALAVLSAAAVLANTAITTASARIADSTENTSSLLQAAVIELDAGPAEDGGDPGRRDLFFDGVGLHPGLPVDRCILVRYAGSVPEIPLVLSAWLDGGTGLEGYLEVVVTAGSGSDPGCSDFVEARSALFDGSLAELTTRHPGFEEGLRVADLTDTEAVTVRIHLEVMSDNDAQGRSTRVGFRFEVRP